MKQLKIFLLCITIFTTGILTAEHYNIRKKLYISVHCRIATPDGWKQIKKEPVILVSRNQKSLLRIELLDLKMSNTLLEKKLDTIYASLYQQGWKEISRQKLYGSGVKPNAAFFEKKRKGRNCKMRDSNYKYKERDIQYILYCNGR